MARATLLTAALIAATAAIGIARAAEPAVWTPVAYSLGEQPLVPVAVSTAITDDAINDDSITVTGRRAPQSSLPGGQLPTPQEVFNVTGDDYRRPAGCDIDYTTSAGQPVEATDVVNATGIRGCYF